MKKIVLALLTALLFATLVNAQWTQRANFPGGVRTKATSFTVDGKIYVVGGLDNSGVVRKDVWAYDIATNVWTHKSDFPGPERYGAVSFVINGFGFIATGGNDFGYLDDLWEYDATGDTWLQRPGMPVTSPQHENQRREAFAFVIGGKAYIGGGDGWVFGANQTTNYAFPDLWEYSPLTNNWIQKTGFPDFIGRDFSIGVTIGNKGYVGLGCDVGQTTPRQTFWEYDPATDSWASKASFPTVFTTDASAFVIDSSLYVVGGVKFNPVALSSQFYKYEPANDTWTLLTPFSGGAVAGHFSVSDGTTAFLGTGYHSNLTLRNDLWEFTSTTSGIGSVNIPSGKVAMIFPNPFVENATLLLNKDVPNASLEIFNVLGEKVKSMKLNGETQVVLNDFCKGVFSFRLLSNGEQVDCGKFVVE